MGLLSPDELLLPDDKLATVLPFFLSGLRIQLRCDGVGLLGEISKILCSGFTISSPRLAL
jgi:hypothetical protein